MKKKIIIVLGCLILIAIIVVISLYIGNSQARLWMDRKILKRDLGEDDLPSIKVEDDNIKVYAYSSYIATVENNTLSIYNGSAKKEATINISVTNPKFASSGKYLLVADDGGENLYLIYNDSLQWQKKMEGDISQIAVNSNGAVCVVLTGTTYKSVIVMYDIIGKEQFRTFLASTSATDVIISDDNKYLSFVDIKTSGMSIESRVKTISVDKAKNTPNESIIHTYTMSPNVLALKIKYKKDKIVVLCDDSVHILSDGSDEELFKIDNNISFVDISLEGYACKVTEGKQNSLLKNEYELQIQNIDNKKISSYMINSTVKNLYCSDSVVAISQGGEVEFVNTRGWLIKKFNSIQNIKDISIGDSVVAIVYRNRIEVMGL